MAVQERLYTAEDLLELPHDIKRYELVEGHLIEWVVYPKSRRIYAYRTETDLQILREADTLDGGDVLPGFAVKLTELFAVLDKR